MRAAKAEWVEEVAEEATAMAGMLTTATVREEAAAAETSAAMVEAVAREAAQVLEERRERWGWCMEEVAEWRRQPFAEPTRGSHSDCRCLCEG